MADENAQSIKDRLLQEAAVILEQEGWLLNMIRREVSSRRINGFAERYAEWQSQVNQARLAGQDMWPQPPDNS